MTRVMTREEIRKALTGPVGAVPTPFLKDGTIDFKGLCDFVDFIIAAGSKCLLLTYGVSLYSVLSDQEVAEVTQTVIEHNAGRVMVVAADKMWCTGQEVQFAKYVRELGADLLMVSPPDWGSSCTPRSMADHYAAVAEHIPVMAVSGVWIDRSVDFALETLRVLSETVDGVVALKDDSYDTWRGGGNFGRKAGLMVHDQWAIMCVSKCNFLDASHYGCDGYLSPYLMFKPAVAHAYWKAMESGDSGGASRIIVQYEMPLHELFKSFPGGFDPALHGIYELCGIVKRWRRRPYYSANDEDMEKLAGFLKGLALL